MNTKNLTTVWFIDDNAHLRKSIKDCFDIKSESSVYKNKNNRDFKISTINPGIYGEKALDIIEKTGYDNGILVPDLILLDLRYPIDKKNNETDILKLHGIKVLEKVLSNEYMENTCVVVFSQFFIDSVMRTTIIDKSKIKERELRFIAKQKLKYDDLSLVSINIQKECHSVKFFIDKLTDS